MCVAQEMMNGYSDEVYSSVTQRESSSQTLLHKNEDRLGHYHGGGGNRSNR